MVKDPWLILFTFILLSIMITADAILTFSVQGPHYTHIIDLVAISAGIYLVYCEFRQ